MDIKLALEVILLEFVRIILEVCLGLLLLLLCNLTRATADFGDPRNTSRLIPLFPKIGVLLIQFRELTLVIFVVVPQVLDVFFRGLPQIFDVEFPLLIFLILNPLVLIIDFFYPLFSQSPFPLNLTRFVLFHAIILVRLVLLDHAHLLLLLSL